MWDPGNRSVRTLTSTLAYICLSCATLLCWCWLTMMKIVWSPTLKKPKRNCWELPASHAAPSISGCTTSPLLPLRPALVHVASTPISLANLSQQPPKQPAATNNMASTTPPTDISKMPQLFTGDKNQAQQHVRALRPAEEALHGRWCQGHALSNPHAR